MKIIIKDNYDRDYISDRLLCENISEHWGQILVEILNQCYSSDNNSDYFKLVSDDYKLFVWQP